LWANVRQGFSIKKLIILFAVGLLTQQVIQAQGTICLSNLGQAFAGNLAVGSDSWYAALFFTGTNADGYLLDSVQLGMAGATGDPSGFTVAIYTQTGVAGGGAPGRSLGALNGSSNPTSAGLYTYAPTSSVALSRDTPYYIVLTAGTAIVGGAYDWNYVGAYAYSQNGGWRTFADVMYSGDGSSWSQVGYPGGPSDL
jgi:hypothetical protein